MGIYKSPYAFPKKSSDALPPKEMCTVAEGDVNIRTNTPYPPLDTLAGFDGARFLDFSKPTLVQRYAIPAIQNGNSALIRAPTGMGKTLCFLLPLIQNINYSSIGVQLCVVSPTHELCEQIRREASRISRGKQLTIESIYGKKKRLPSYSRVDILVGTPGRLNDFLGTGLVSFSALKYFIMDEADKLLDMGFKPVLLDIKQHVPSSASISLFSATFPRTLQSSINQFLPTEFILVEITNETLKTIKQTIIEEDNKKEDQLLEILKGLKLTAKWKEECTLDRTIIFVERKITAQQLGDKLQAMNMKCQSLHGDKEPTERANVMNRFRSGASPLLVATSVAARGIDVKDVRLVINYEFPRDIKDYIHRIGRTGREGKTGEAISFINPTAIRGDLREELISVLKESGNPIPAFLAKPRRGEYSRGGRHRAASVDEQPAQVDLLSELAARITIKEKEDSDEDMPGEW